MVSRGVGGGALCDVQHEKPFGGMMHKNVPLKAITPIPLGLNTDSISKDRRKRTVAAQAGMDSVDSAGANKRKERWQSDGDSCRKAFAWHAMQEEGWISSKGGESSNQRQEGIERRGQEHAFCPGIASGSAFEEHRRDAALK